MKRLILAGLLAIAGAAPSLAQTTIRVGGSGSGGVVASSTAEQDLVTPVRKAKHNLDLCRLNGIASAANCTQANLNARPGCSNPSAGECGKIYAASAVGDGEYFLDKLLGKVCIATCVSAPSYEMALLFDVMQRESVRIEESDARAAYFDPANSQVAPQALCTATLGVSSCTYREAACGALQKDRTCKLTP